MTAQKHLFVMDELDRLNLALDTSLRFAYALSKDSATPYYCTIEELSVSNRQGALARCSEIHFSGDIETAVAGERSYKTLSEFKSIHMRKDPPFNMAYIEATWILDRAPSSTLLLNSPAMLRGFNEKLGIIEYPNQCLECLVSANPEQIHEYMERQDSKTIILKPLDLFGGRGVVKVSLGPTSMNQIRKATENGSKQIMAQPFLEEIYKGEVRVFTIDGDPIAWCLKKPAAGEYLANTRMGATLHDYTPSESLVKNVKNVARSLADRGVYILGMDVIGEKITEINITSPRLLTADMTNLSGFKRYSQWVRDFKV